MSTVRKHGRQSDSSTSKPRSTCVPLCRHALSLSLPRTPKDCLLAVNTYALPYPSLHSLIVATVGGANNESGCQLIGSKWRPFMLTSIRNKRRSCSASRLPTGPATRISPSKCGAIETLVSTSYQSRPQGFWRLGTLLITRSCGA